jgi:arsenite-transporting ATPase
MKFLDHPPRFLFFTGKGGVGKTSIAAAMARSPLLRQRAANELREIDAVANQYAQRYTVVPLLQQEPVGVIRLLELAGR